MGISRKKWGYLEWFDEDLNPGVNVGIVVMNPGSHHAPHKHYDEQILYVLQGQAISIVDGIETSISAGSRFHWKAGITHEVYNIGNVPFMHLLVSIPNELNRNRKEYYENLKDSSFTIQLNEVIDQLRSQLLNQVNFPYAIFDSEGRYIIGGPCSNHYCEKKCNRSMLQEFCSCMKYEHPEDIQKEKEFICPYHLNIINIPIFVNQVFLGAVQGGYYWTSGHGGAEEEEFYDVPESTKLMMHNFLHQISQIIVSYCEYEQSKRQFSQNLEELEKSRNSESSLITRLKNAENQVTDLKINHHFLFNSLNSMSAMALRSGNPELHQSIVDLSKMFQYTLRTQTREVKFIHELNYVMAYLNLQKIRFKKHLTIDLHIEAECKDLSMPFNVLQPIVENAFVHGFHSYVDKWLGIRAKEEEGFLIIDILNSGNPLTEDEIKTVDYKIRGGTAHGLSMVYNKLKSIYGQLAELDVFTDAEQHTCFRMRIPVKENRI